MFFFIFRINFLCCLHPMKLMKLRIVLTLWTRAEVRTSTIKLQLTLNICFCYSKLKIKIEFSFFIFYSSTDSLISRDEYENYQKRKYEKLYGHPMPQDELKMAAWKFHTIDVDNSGFISYWELLNYESMIILARRSQVL